MLNPIEYVRRTFLDGIEEMALWERMLLGFVIIFVAVAVGLLIGGSIPPK